VLHTRQLQPRSLSCRSIGREGVGKQRRRRRVMVGDATAMTCRAMVGDADATFCRKPRQSAAQTTSESLNLRKTARPETFRGGARCDIRLEMAKVPAASLKDEIEGLRSSQKNGYLPLPVAIVGSQERSLDIFEVLSDLKLARTLNKDEVEARSKSKTKGERTGDVQDKRKPENQIKDKESGKIYVVDSRPSVVISITGDAQDLPDDHDLNLCVDDITSFCESREELSQKLTLNREAASRALLANCVYKPDVIDKAIAAAAAADRNKEAGQTSWDEKFNRAKSSKCLQISLLIQQRILELRESFKDDPIFQDHFAYPSVRDVMLNVAKGIKEQYEFLEKHIDVLKREPIASGKRLSKARSLCTVITNIQFELCSVAFRPRALFISLPHLISSRRLAKFFDGGVMGAALKVSGANSSAWIVDGGT
jgi:hypothetical protein